MMKKRVLPLLLALCLCLSACALPAPPSLTGAVSSPAPSPAASAASVPAAVSRAGAPRPVEIEALPEGEWMVEAAFPDWKGYTDDTLALNSVLSFRGYQGQGELCLCLAEGLERFSLRLNGAAIDTAGLAAGKLYRLDCAALTQNGVNTLQVTGIEPAGLRDAVRVYIPYPVVLEGTPEEVGLQPRSLQLVDELIAADVEAGFPSAQLAVLRNGRLVYEKAWGRVNAYLPDGTPNAESPAVTTETLYDLASVTKMFAVNYAIQRLVTEGRLRPEDQICLYIGDRFWADVLDFRYEGMEEIGLDLQRAWKASLTVRDLLCHQGGFPADLRYYNPNVDAVTQRYGPDYENVLFSGNDGSPETKAATVEAMCQTPLIYQPGTRTLYSDVDYMLLGVVVEQITGRDLDSYLKETFCEPLGLTRVSFTPLEHGFAPDDCAATELNGNTRDGLTGYPGVRTRTLQGEVHDEIAYACMGGVSGHAGLFADASELAKLGSLMLTGGYGQHRFFSEAVLESFTAPKALDAENWGLGWWRQGDGQRPWYFGTQASSGTFGHQGWTGTILMIDPERQLVVVYLTNKINSPITSPYDPDRFNGAWYTASTLGFVPQLLSVGMDSERPVEEELLELLLDMANESMKLVPQGARANPTHPAFRNVESKLGLCRSWVERFGAAEHRQRLEELEARWQAMQ